MYLNKLINILPPPCNIDVDSILKNIELVEKHFKIKFPKDFVKFSTNYGSGQISEYITIYSVINSPAYYDMVQSECKNYCDFKQKFPKQYKHHVFPEKNGLFPLGRTDGGCLMWWNIAAQPEDWSIVIYDENSWEYEEYDMQLCEFIYKYFTKQICCKAFPDSLLEDGKCWFGVNIFDFSRYCM